MLARRGQIPVVTIGKLNGKRALRQGAIGLEHEANLAEHLTGNGGNAHLTNAQCLQNNLFFPRPIGQREGAVGVCHSQSRQGLGILGSQCLPGEGDLLCRGLTVL